MGKCPFCQIDSEKTRIIRETELSRVVFSNPRLMPGHLLVMPKRHIEKLSDLTREERDDILDLIVEFQEKILSNLASGCDIRQNYRPFQKESRLKVHHFHMHLQPRELFDEMYEKCQKNEIEVFQDLSEEEMSKILKNLK